VTEVEEEDRAAGHFRPASRKHPVNVIPAGEADLHLHGGHCRCYPSLEVWKLPGQGHTHRLMHHQLAEQEAAP
jgi:hypothetical protein